MSVRPLVRRLVHSRPSFLRYRPSTRSLAFSRLCSSVHPCGCAPARPHARSCTRRRLRLLAIFAGPTLGRPPLRSLIRMSMRPPARSYGRPYLRSSACSFARSALRPRVRANVRSCVRASAPFVRASMSFRSPAPSPVRPDVQSFPRSFFHTSLHPSVRWLLARPFHRPCTRPSFRSPARSFVRPSFCPCERHFIRSSAQPFTRPITCPPLVSSSVRASVRSLVLPSVRATKNRQWRRPAEGSKTSGHTNENLSRGGRRHQNCPL